MAYIHTENCRNCGNKFEAWNDEYLCNSCNKLKEKEKYDEYMKEVREGKSLEERIAQIEDWIYKEKNTSHDYTLTLDN